jgi:acyl carrier protein
MLDRRSAWAARRIVSRQFAVYRRSPSSRLKETIIPVRRRRPAGELRFQRRIFTIIAINRYDIRDRENSLSVEDQVVGVIGRVLELGGRKDALTRDTRLLGSMPELDSMAVATLITSLEEHFDFVIDDDEIDGTVFTTVGSLTDFVQAKLAV